MNQIPKEQKEIALHSLLLESLDTPFRMKENEKMILERLQNVSEMLSEGMMTKDMLIKELFERNNENQERQSELNNLRHQLEERDQQYDNQVNKMRARLDSLFEDTDKNSVEAK